MIYDWVDIFRTPRDRFADIRKDIWTHWTELDRRRYKLDRGVVSVPEHSTSILSKKQWSVGQKWRSGRRASPPGHHHRPGTAQGSRAGESKGQDRNPRIRSNMRSKTSFDEFRNPNFRIQSLYIVEKARGLSRRRRDRKAREIIRTFGLKNGQDII